MESVSGLIIFIVIVSFIIFILCIRLFGAWMLRIDEVIKLQRQMLDEIRKLTNYK